jgi:hypothetical protein
MSYHQKLPRMTPPEMKKERGGTDPPQIASRRGVREGGSSSTGAADLTQRRSPGAK